MRSRAVGEFRREDSPHDSKPLRAVQPVLDSGGDRGHRGGGGAGGADAVSGVADDGAQIISGSHQDHPDNARKTGIAGPTSRQDTTRGVRRSARRQPSELTAVTAKRRAPSEPGRSPCYRRPSVDSRCGRRSALHIVCDTRTYPGTASPSLGFTYGPVRIVLNTIRQMAESKLEDIESERGKGPRSSTWPFSADGQSVYA